MHQFLIHAYTFSDPLFQQAFWWLNQKQLRNTERVESIIFPHFFTSKIAPRKRNSVREAKFLQVSCFVHREIKILEIMLLHTILKILPCALFPAVDREAAFSILLILLSGWFEDSEIIILLSCWLKESHTVTKLLFQGKLKAQSQELGLNSSWADMATKGIQTMSTATERFDN